MYSRCGFNIHVDIFFAVFTPRFHVLRRVQPDIDTDITGNGLPARSHLKSLKQCLRKRVHIIHRIHRIW